MNLIINLFKLLFINNNHINFFTFFSFNLITLFYYIKLQTTLIYLIAFDFLNLLISFFSHAWGGILKFYVISLYINNNYLKNYFKAPQGFILKFVLLKFEFILFIYFELPSLLFKIRVFYLFSIIIINLLILLSYYTYDLQFITFDTLVYFNFLNNQLDDNFIYSIPNNGDSSQNDFNLSNNNSSNNNTDPSNNPNPNPFGSENNAIVVINGNQERDNDLTSNFNDSNLTTRNEDMESQSRLLFRASSPVTLFNEISYDPQYDDQEFNSKVLYPYNHPWFERMVQNHIDNLSIGSVIRAINNYSNIDNPDWNTNSKLEAIQFINNKIN
jgi:hypothetical protein